MTEFLRPTPRFLLLQSLWVPALCLFLTGCYDQTLLQRITGDAFSATQVITPTPEDGEGGVESSDSGNGETLDAVIAEANNPDAEGTEPAAEESDASGDPSTQQSLGSDPKRPPLSPHQDGIWAKLRKDFSLPYIDNARVRAQKQRYLRHPGYLRKVQQQARPFIRYIADELAKRNFPAELALLPIIESGYEIRALSSGKAAGLWQFIPSTASIFGLRQDWWYDGRNDIISSTRVALNYLDILQKKFDNDWFLTLAAYNTGDGNVRKAMELNQSKGRRSDYWSLPLKTEAKEYVPRLLALAQIFANPEKYELQLEKIDEDTRVTTVKLQRQLDLRLAAKLAGIDLNSLRRLNPGFKRWATSPKGPHHLLLPASSSKTFQQRLAQLPTDKHIRTTVHTVATGESLENIAKRHESDSYLISRLNKLRSKEIHVNQLLLIPVPYSSKDLIALDPLLGNQLSQLGTK